MSVRYLVTGGAGMVGSHAAQRWAARGHQVTVLDNLMRSKLFKSSRESVEFNWRYLASQPRIRLVKGDVRNADDVASAIGDGVDVVLHAAAQPGVGFSIEDPLQDFDINAYGTLQVLNAVRQRCPKATVLYCSTNKVYGTNVDDLPVAERATRYAFEGELQAVPEQLSVDAAGHTPYGVSKLAGELYVQDYAHTYGLRTGVFRMSCIYGTRQFGFEDQGWVAHFTISTLLGRPITVYGDGKQVRDVLYIEDLLDAYDAFIASDFRHGIFNIGGGPANTTSLLELLDLLEAMTGKRSRVRQAPWRPSDQKVYISDIRHAQAALDWRPQIELREGLSRLAEWIGGHLELFGDAAQATQETAAR